MPAECVIDQEATTKNTKNTKYQRDSTIQRTARPLFLGFNKPRASSGASRELFPPFWQFFVFFAFLVVASSSVEHYASN